ncbi:MAG: tetratricopeptide repeat protein [Planctomycetaceae bacterium]|nr:tetratricopeptide repeat protein [Planctomycetaceae bacterium]
MQRILASLVIPVCLLFSTAFLTQPSESIEDSVFLMPQKQAKVRQLQHQMIEAVAAGRIAEGRQFAEDIVTLIPDDPLVYIHLASLYALSNDTDQAIAQLHAAVDHGFQQAEALESNEDLATVHSDPRFAEVLSKARDNAKHEPADRSEPGRPEGQIAEVTERNTEWSAMKGALLVRFVPDDRQLTTPVSTGKGPADRLVNEWFQQGTAAGHVGDLYDNRDRDHSNLSAKLFPQLLRVEYCETAKAQRVEWGHQADFLFDRPVLGNSSTAHVGTAYWRSNPRKLMENAWMATRVYNQYVSNHLYVYPEHQDYDEKHGDVFPANVPFVVVSQGSSGSDQPFLKAFALTMAAFRPETKQRLIQTGTLMPTLQSIFRRCNRPVQSDDDYLTGVAHPIVFQGDQLDVEKMVQMAHEMTPDSLPPMVQLQVVEEELGIPGVDYAVTGEAERLFDTPVAIARIWRSVSRTKRMVVDASASRDLNGKRLTFHWVVLQGDASHVRIRPLNQDSSRCEIQLTWHERTGVTGHPKLQSNRLDIGVFASNGTWMSAPGFVCSLTLAHEKRVYDENDRIQQMDYADKTARSLYVDPSMDLPRDWKDDYHYSPQGKLLGWTRTGTDGKVDQFHSSGGRILQSDEQGRPLKVQPVRYVVERKSGRNSGVIQCQDFGKPVEYAPSNASP